MRKQPRLIVIFTILSVITGTLVVYHWNRPLQIDFTKQLPTALIHCGREIAYGSDEYDELHRWFELNKTGWQNTPATYVSQNIYFSRAISIIIVGNAVVVNYQKRDGDWEQVVRSKTPNELSNDCISPTSARYP